MKEVAYLLKAFGALAVWVRIVIFVLLATTIVGAAAFFGARVALLVAFCLLLLAALFVLYLLLTFWVRRRQAAELKGELVTTAAHRGLTDPAARSRLEDLRRNFVKGVAKFEAAGKDLYDMPWYLMVGEPGAGKTEAIRHSDVGFPTGMQEDFQGVGGTINMNWWFTNHAILLDTAGRLLFEEVEAGATNEWREFLDLLRKHRPNCPVNGLILAIPVDSLLRDTPEELERKAAKIARQLENVQRQLEIRFPAFVLVTKADLLNGFREFFEDVRDPRDRQQMFGWSNPAPLDAPFRPELVDDYLRIVTARLDQRRFRLLEDPTPRAANGRRADEVDGLYELPQNLQALSGRLRRYLEIVFLNGAWTSRPLFLRGIYFTSSMREGAALDQVLAGSLGVPAGALPEGKAWEREHSYFLRDLFLDKVFREDGLVTRVTDVERMLLRRKLTLFGLGTLGLAALLGVGLLGYRSLRENVYSQTGFWARASEGWHGGEWQPIVGPARNGSSVYPYLGNTPVGPGLTAQTRAEFTRPDLTLADFHEALRELAAEPLGVPWVFRAFALAGSDAGRDRARAQRILFETGVVKPLLEAARQKMGGAVSAGARPLDPRPPERVRSLEAKALTALVALEVDVRQRRPKVDGIADRFLAPLLDYVSDQANPGQLGRVMEWTYGENPDGRGTWAPDWASGGDALSRNPAIQAGLDHLLADARERIKNLVTDLQRLTQLAEAARAFQGAEVVLAAKASVKNDPETSDREVAAALDKLQASKAAMEEKIGAVRQAGLFEDGPETLGSAYQKLTAGSQSRFGQIAVMQAEIERVLPTPVRPDDKATAKVLGPAVVDDPRFALLREVQVKLAEVTRQLKVQLDNGVPEAQLKGFGALDEGVLDSVDGRPAYLVRWDLYQECRTGAPQQHYNERMVLLNQNWRPLQQLSAALAALQSRVEDYNGKMKEQLTASCGYFIQRTEDTQKQLFAVNYLRQAKTALRQLLRFPLLWPPVSDSAAMTIEQVKQAKSLVGMIHRDLAVDSFDKLPSASRQSIVDFTKGLNPLLAFTDAIMHGDGSLASVTVTLMNGQAQRQLSGPDLAPAATPPPPGSPPKRSLLSQLFVGDKPTPTPPPELGYNPRNWNAVELVGGRLVPVDAPTDVSLGKFKVNDGFKLRVYHTPTGGGGSDLVNCGENWASLRALARLGGKPVDANGQVWRLSLKPGEPIAVWVQFAFEQPLPPAQNWPTLDTLGLRDLLVP
ncbi:MAG TPA: type VI secretion protein IcmF/TssM N-terminal domain-containing protein [Chthoniobacterales bacterium]